MQSIDDIHNNNNNLEFYESLTNKKLLSEDVACAKIGNLANRRIEPTTPEKVTRRICQKLLRHVIILYWLLSKLDTKIKLKLCSRKTSYQIRLSFKLNAMKAR